MGLEHERLDIYRLSVGYVVWCYEKADELTGNHRSTRDQWRRFSQSVPLNMRLATGKRQKQTEDGILGTPQ